MNEMNSMFLDDDTDADGEIEWGEGVWGSIAI